MSTAELNYSLNMVTEWPAQHKGGLIIPVKQQYHWLSWGFKSIIIQWCLALPNVYHITFSQEICLLICIFIMPYHTFVYHAFCKLGIKQ